MKRILALLMALALCLSMVGCGNANKKAKAALTAVLEKSESFTVKNPYTDRITEESLDNFYFPVLGGDQNNYQPKKYTFVDMDGDGVEEMVIHDADHSFYLILRYTGDMVRGYMVASRGLIDLKTDGSFSTSSGISENTVSTMTFADADYELKHKIYESEVEKTYLVDGEAADPETVNLNFKNWNKDTTKVTWVDIK